MNWILKILFVVTLSWAELACAQEGTLKWKYNVGSLILNFPSIGQNSTIYLSPKDFNGFYAFNPDGTVQWMIATVGAYFNTSPMVEPNGTIIVNFGPSVQAYNPNGTLQWSTTVFTGLNNGNILGLGPDDTLYLAGDSGLRAFTLQGVQKWEYKISN